MRMFCVANHAPEAVISALCRRRFEMSDLAILAHNTLLPPVPAHRVYLLTSFSDVRPNLSAINSQAYEGTYTFVFSDPISLASIKGAVFLDFLQTADPSGLEFCALPLDLRVLKAPRNKVSIIPTNSLEKLIAKVERGSFLNPFMTFIYSLPSTMQTTTKNSVAHWLFSKATLPPLLKTLNGPLPPKALHRLSALLSGELAGKFKAACSSFRVGCSVDQVCSDYEIAPYEFRYLLSVVSDKTKFADSFDRAKNRKKER